MHNDDPRYEQVVRDARKLADSVSSLIKREGYDAGKMWEEKKELAREKMYEAKEMAMEKGKEIDVYAREHVWETVAISALVGFIAGFFTSRRR